MDHKVAVVIPVYNPPHHWEESCLEHIIALRALFPHYHFHFSLVNDGSSGHVFRRIRKVLKQSKIQHSFHQHSDNLGKGKALRTGVSKNLDAHFFICVDWDFPFGVLIIGEILEKLVKGHPVVLINRGQEYLKKLPFFRAILTRMWRVFIQQIFDLQVGDTQAGVRGFAQSVVPHFLECRTNCFLHDLEFILNCKLNKVPLTTLPAHLRGGVKLHDFSLTTYLRELRVLGSLTAAYYFQSKYPGLGQR